MHGRRQRGGATADAGVDRRAAAARLQGPAHRPARAAGGEPQGRLHRPREVGRAARPHAPAGRRRIPEDLAVATHRPFQGAHAGAAGRRHRRHARQRGRTARAAREDAGARQGRGAPAGPARRPEGGDGRRRADAPHRPRQGVLDQARLPRLRHQLPRAGPAHVLVQQQARLVPRLRGHRPHADARAAQGPRRFGARRRHRRAREDLRRTRDRGRGRRALRHLPWRALEPGLAGRAFRPRGGGRAVDRRGGGARGERRAPLDRDPEARWPRGHDRTRRDRRDPLAAGLPRPGGPGLSDARSRRAHAERRRGAAHPPRGAAGQQSAGRVLRAR
ncbi:hypothetical protein X551_04637 [Methylibium sp. T29]|nr:hypothetical protein X551_04637 [Methylibium sp. T29]